MSNFAAWPLWEVATIRASIDAFKPIVLEYLQILHSLDLKELRSRFLKHTRQICPLFSTARKVNFVAECILYGDCLEPEAWRSKGVEELFNYHGFKLYTYKDRYLTHYIDWEFTGNSEPQPR